MTESNVAPSEEIALAPDVYKAQIDAMLAEEDYEGCALLKAPQERATSTHALDDPVEQNEDLGEDAPWPADDYE